MSAGAVITRSGAGDITRSGVGGIARSGRGKVAISGVTRVAISGVTRVAISVVTRLAISGVTRVAISGLPRLAISRSGIVPRSRACGGGAEVGLTASGDWTEQPAAATTIARQSDQSALLAGVDCMRAVMATDVPRGKTFAPKGNAASHRGREATRAAESVDWRLQGAARRGGYCEVLRNTWRVVEPVSATTTSSLVSPLKSAIQTPCGKLPVVYVI